MCLLSVYMYKINGVEEIRINDIYGCYSCVFANTTIEYLSDFVCVSLCVCVCLPVCVLTQKVIEQGT